MKFTYWFQEKTKTFIDYDCILFCIINIDYIQERYHMFYISAKNEDLLCKYLLQIGTQIL